MRRIVICLILSTAWQLVAGQIVKEHQLGIGARSSRLMDASILPSAVSGTMVETSYSFTRSAATRKQSLSLAWGHGRLSNAAASATVNGFDLRFSQGYSVLSIGGFRSYLGYSLSSTPVYTRSLQKDTEKYSWSTGNDLSLYYSGMYTTACGQWMLDLYMPVIGLASRPDESSDDQHTTAGLLYDSYGRLFGTSWRNRQQVAASLGYSRQLSNRVQLNLKGQFSYQALQSSYPYKETSIGLSAGVAWRRQ